MNVLESRFFAERGHMCRELKFGESQYVSKVPSGETSNPGLAAWWMSYLRGETPSTDTKRGQLRVLELFSGPGGLFQGFKQACSELGFHATSIAAVDEDAEALRVYKENHLTLNAETDSAALLVNWEPFEDSTGVKFFSPPEVAREWLRPLVGTIDVLLAGPPCQGHSNLNNRTRRTDSRNELYLTVPALAAALKVPRVIIENVPAVIHDKSGVLDAASSLFRNSGYSVESGVIQAHKIGWPQTRKRHFLVASVVNQVLNPRVIEKALSSEPFSVMWALEDLEDVESDHFMDQKTALSEENQLRVEHLHDNGEFDLRLDLRPECHQAGTTYKSVYGRMYPDRPAPTLTTGFLTPGRGRFVHPTRPRVLTPREAARLQGFPDTYKFSVNGESSPKTKLAKWIGDAVPMPLGYVAGLSLLLDNTPPR